MKYLTKLYLMNVVVLFLIAFVIQIIITLLANNLNDETDFTGISVWIIFIVFLIYRIIQRIKVEMGKFLTLFFILFLPLFIISRYFTIFDFIEPRFYGSSNSILYSFSATNERYDVSKFLFWQTGISGGFNYDKIISNKIITFFTVPPVALFECFLKAIFPGLYIILVVQLPLLLLKKNVLLWYKN